jgi:hypothetical protein
MILIFNNENVLVTHNDDVNIDFQKAYGQDIELVFLPNSTQVSKSILIERDLNTQQVPEVPMNYDEFQTLPTVSEFSMPQFQDVSLTRTEIKENVKANSVFKDLIQNKLTELVCKGLDGYKYSEFLKECILESNISVNVLDNALQCKLVNTKRDLAYEHITKYYPLWKQNNVILSGTEQEKIQMTTFIEAVRAWSNDTNSTNEQLNTIQP